jgi:hypothetical protein
VVVVITVDDCVTKVPNDAVVVLVLVCVVISVVSVDAVNDLAVLLVTVTVVEGVAAVTVRAPVDTPIQLQALMYSE